MVRQSRFRRALALGIDRDQINEAFFLGLGVTGTPIPADIIDESPGKDTASAGPRSTSPRPMRCWMRSA
jgi:ABC-type dipeptide transport system, periplasmic component